MFSSDKWKLSGPAASIDGKRIEAIVLDSRDFWPHVAYCLRAAIPILKVFRLVDSYTSPSMGFLRKAMDQGKKKKKEVISIIQKFQECNSFFICSIIIVTYMTFYVL